MMRLLATVSSIATLLVVPAWAQSGNPAGMTPGTGQHQPNHADRLFAYADKPATRHIKEPVTPHTDLPRPRTVGY